MIPKLPLHSPRWLDLHGVAVEEVEKVLGAMASTGATDTGDEWKAAWRCVADGLLQQETVFDGAYAVLPHLVEVAAAQSPALFVDLWVDMGLMVTAEGGAPVPADLEEGFRAALRPAEQAAVRSFLAADSPATDCAYLALSCVALAGHHMGRTLWWFLVPEERHLQLVCPGCDIDTEIPEFFVDPLRPPFQAPGLPDPAHVRQGEHPWGEVAAALREAALGEGWEPFLRVARAVAAAGVPPETPGQAVLCLVAAMVAVKGTPEWAGREWARKLMLLTGCFRCPNCERTWTIADCLADAPGGAHPQDHAGQAWTIADWSATAVASAAAGRADAAVTGLRRDGSALLAADGTSRGRVTVFADSAPGSREGVNSLAVVSRSGGPTLVAGAGDRGVVWLWDMADGRLRHDPLPGHPDPVRSMTALPLPEGHILLASGGDTGTIALWDPITGRPVREPAGNWLGAVSGMCIATVPDGRTLLVTATSRGAVRLRDPSTGESVGRLNPYGRPIESIAAVRIAPGHTLIAASDRQGDVHMWDPAVDDPWEPGAAVPLSKRALEELRHRVAAVAAVPLRDRTLLATGDRNGVVMLWDPATGAPIGDGLPPDGPGSSLTAMAVTTLPGRGTVLLTGSKQGRSLRVWEPETGTGQHIDLDVAVTCLAAAGSEVIVGHDCGVFGLSLTM
ncbi:WD40 repeat domain-containing protein [Streptomyces sp. NPDC059468]|uniref:WD40 repeat domain-containing protein n=1 Tax=Streptomyces sp. NPDC059468 TaxID=3346845 RepID=UPI00367B44AE